VSSSPADQSGDTLAGTLVHRLFERHGTTLTDTIGEELSRLIRDDESGDIDERRDKRRGRRGRVEAQAAQQQRQERPALYEGARFSASVHRADDSAGRI
jgi:hypothetical protein